MKLFELQIYSLFNSTVIYPLLASFEQRIIFNSKDVTFPQKLAPQKLLSPFANSPDALSIRGDYQSFLWKELVLFLLEWFRNERNLFLIRVA